MMAEIIDDYQTFTITLTAPPAAGGTPDSSATPGSLQWIADVYDSNGDRVIDGGEVQKAYDDYRAGVITSTSYSAVGRAYREKTVLPAAAGVPGTTPTCNAPSVNYPDNPDISITGDIASCRVTINTGDGSKLNPTTSTVEVWDGESWLPNVISRLDLTKSLQTKILSWPIKKSSDVIHCTIYIKNACGAESGWVKSQTASYTEPTATVANGTIVSIDAPTSVVQGATASVACTIRNAGTASGRFRIDLLRHAASGARVSQGSMGTVTLAAGRTYTTAATNFTVPATGTSVKYEIRCVRLT